MARSTKASLRSFERSLPAWRRPRNGTWLQTARLEEDMRSGFMTLRQLCRRACGRRESDSYSKKKVTILTGRKALMSYPSTNEHLRSTAGLFLRFSI